MTRSVGLSVVPTAQVVPGDALSLALTVQNTGGGVDRYRIDVLGMQSTWYALDTADIVLAAGAGECVRLTVHPPADATPGCYPLGVQVTSECDPAVRASAVVTLTVVTAEGVFMDLLPAEAEGPQATFRITFRNHTHAHTATAVVASDRADELCYRVEPEGYRFLPPGGECTVAVHVAPREPAASQRPHCYDIEFRGLQSGRLHESNPSLVRQAQFTYVPPDAAPWSRLASRRWALACALLPIALLLLAFAGNHTLAALVARARTIVPIASAVSRSPIAGATAPARASTALLPRSESRSRASAVGQLLLNPRIVRFGPQAIDSMSAVQTVHVVNLGPRPLTITRVAIIGADAAEFSARDTCTHRTIGVDAACTIGVSFGPIDAGTRSAGLIIAGNAATSLQTILLTGSGGSGT